MSRLLLISSDCHAGGLPAHYADHMDKRHHAAAKAWWVGFAKEMLARTGTFFDQESVDEFNAKAGEGRGLMTARRNQAETPPDDELYELLSDESSPFSPRRGEFDATVRMQELDADGVAGEVVFPQMAPFGAGLTQYRDPVPPELNWVGIQAYNRWLADFCNSHPGRMAGVALINVEDIDASVQEVRDAHALGLFGGVLLPGSTGQHPYYHHPRYEPLWAVCEELDMPVQAHSGWAPDYGDVPAAPAMFISEVDMFAQRPFRALVWSGAFERHPGLKLVLTEVGVGWIVEALRVLKFKADNPIFKHFTQDLSLTPAEYFQRQCYLGASFLSPHEGAFREQIGVDKLMYGTDYPHLEGTWPNTMEKMRETFAEYPEAEIRAILGENALQVYRFDRKVLEPIAAELGPELAAIRGEKHAA